jgi:hypothetical protein
MIKIPYDRLQLTVALIALSRRKDLEEKLKEITSKLEGIVPNSKKDLNQKTADENGITLEQLINSHNYEKLCQDYRESSIRKLITEMQALLEITDVQAWAIFADAKGLLD